MQYLLTKEEYESLVPKSELESRDKALDLARRLLLEAHKFTCIHDPEGHTYCDFCPCSGPSKDSQLYRKLCNRRKNYSK